MSILSALLVLVPGGILIAIGSMLLVSNAITYISYLKALEIANQNPQYCEGVRCICNNLRCITKEEREREFLDTNLMIVGFLGTGAFLTFLYGTPSFFKARRMK